MSTNKPTESTHHADVSNDRQSIDMSAKADDPTSTDRAALLPCPFCGSPAILNVLEAHRHSMSVPGLPAMPDYGGGAVVECSACSAGLISDMAPDNIAAVTAAWNRRASSAAAVTVEPVAWIRGSGKAMLEAAGYCTVYASEGQSNYSTPLYAATPAPPQTAGQKVAWVPCAERMPPPDGRYLVWFSGDCIGIAHTFSKWKHPSHPLGYLIQGHGGSHNDVTHWMPLPPAPGAAPPQAVPATPAAPVAVDAAPELPPLPAHKHSLNSGSFAPLFTADQMRDYARAALRAAGAGSREPGAADGFGN